MATNANWPQTVTQVALNGGLGTAESSLTWTDLSSRCWLFGCNRGRQYELDQVQAGVGGITLSNSDEALSPTNTAGAYYPSLLPYRPVMQQAMWPPTPLGAAVNLAGTAAGYDPSFEATAVGAAPPLMVEFGVNAAVAAASPHSGTHSLQWSVASGGGTQVAGIQVSCIPGQQYTASVYYRQTAANTGLLFVNGGAGSATTTTTGSYVRLTVTFTATAAAHQLYVGSIAPGSNSTVNIDDLQMEVGGSASAYNATGPVIYGVHRSYVERWPTKWNHGGLYGYSEITTVDAFAALAAKELSTEYPTEVLNLLPDFYWRLSEPSTTTSFADGSGFGGPPMQLMASKYGAGTAPKAGDDMGIVGDPSGTGVSFTPSAGLTSPVTMLGVGPIVDNSPPLLVPDVIGSSWAVSVAAWVKVANNGTSQVVIRSDNTVSAATGSIAAYVPIQIDLSSAGAFPMLSFQNLSHINNLSSSIAIADGLLHHVVGVVSQDATNTILTIYVDGVVGGTSTTSTATLGGMLGARATSASVGGYFDGSAAGFALDGSMAHLALWYRALSSDEVSGLYEAGLGYPGESFHDRVERYLVAGLYQGLVLVDAGSSTMGASGLSDKTKLLDALQAVVLSENGNMWADGSGVLQCAGRSRRYNTTSPQWTLGEAESPYEGDITFDFDPTLIYNDVQVTQTNGIKAVATDDASASSYGPRTYEREINVASAAETQDAADWILATHKNPYQRVETITIRPSANPALWPMALGADIGQRVTVKRRTVAGSGISADFFIESVTHDQKPDDWTVQYQMSPVGATGQPWILQDATYGVLGTTTVLGY